MRKLMVVLAVLGLLLVAGQVWAEEVSIREESAVSTEYSNPAAEFAAEVFSFMTDNGIGGGAYVSNQSNDPVPLISLQLGQSEHDWLKWGIDTPCAEDNVLKAIGVYGGVNGNKIIEKVIGRYPEKIETVVGYTTLYYFNDADNIDAGLDGGWFFLFQKKI
jgi:hypothetical protein